MVYVMTQKFLKKNIEKMAMQSEYFIIDGENYGVSGTSANRTAIASEFSRSHSSGGFSPERRLYTMLRKKKDDIDVNEDKYEKETKEFLSSKSFIASVNVALKAVVAGGPNNPINVFVVLPSIVFKYLGERIIMKMNKLTKLEYKVAYSQKKLKEDGIKECLTSTLSSKKLKELDKATKRIEKKYKLVFSANDVDDDEY